MGRNGARGVTMKTIAEHLDVSLSTVARSLKDGDRISPDTVARVRDAAAELGYVRDLGGVRLRTGKTFVLMTFFGAAPEEQVGDSGSTGLLHGIHRRVSSTDYAVRTVSVEHGDDGACLARLHDVVRGNRADGVILDHTEPQDRRVRYLLDAGFPFVTFGRTELLAEHPYFDTDNEHAARLETCALIEQGARRIGLLNADAGYTFARQRLAGYRAALAEGGIPFDATLVRHLPIETEAARTAGRDLIERHAADGLVCVNDIVLLGARAGVRELGPEALRRTRLAFRTGTNIVDYLGTPATAAYFDRDEAGWHLADFLLGRIDGRAVSGLQQVVRCTLRNFRGDSVAGRTV